MENYEKRIEEEIERVRNLGRNSSASCWVKIERPKNKSWEDDPLTIFSGNGTNQNKQIESNQGYENCFTYRIIVRKNYSTYTPS